MDAANFMRDYWGVWVCTPSRDVRVSVSAMSLVEEMCTLLHYIASYYDTVLLCSWWFVDRRGGLPKFMRDLPL